MEEKLIRMKANYANMYKLFRILWGFILIYSILYIVYSVVIIFMPAIGFEAVRYQNGQWSIINKNMTFYMGNEFSSHIVIWNAYGIVNPKVAHIVCLVANLITGIIPLLLIAYWIKRTLYNMSHDVTPFSIESVKNIKLISYTVIIASVINEPLWALLVRIFITKNFSMQLTLGLGGIWCGLLVFELARIFDYVCELQKEHDVEVYKGV